MRNGFGLLAATCIFIFSCGEDKKAPKAGKPALPSSFTNENYDSLGLAEGIFDIPELPVSPSPDKQQSFELEPGKKVIDLDVSPIAPVAAMIVQDASNNFGIHFWDAAVNNRKLIFSFPKGYHAKEITWHPKATALFVICEKENKHHVFRIDKTNNGYRYNIIFSSRNQLKRIVSCPRPFVLEYDYKEEKEFYGYRILFGEKYGDNSFRIVSITETGSRFYQVIGPKKTITHFEYETMPPSEMVSEWALPVAFHPAGHQLIWEGHNGKHFLAYYAGRGWADKFDLLSIRSDEAATYIPTPNGLGLFTWRKEKPGIGLFLLTDQKEQVQLTEFFFTASPIPVPDGKGIIGLTSNNGRFVLNYFPVNVPLADVVNAWMYCESAEELSLFKKNYGLFRGKGYEQLYMLYETENYYCGDYDRNVPTRPYMVTTDIFWELFGAAFQGLFIVKEKDVAIPSFWKFIESASIHFKKTNSGRDWIPAFAALQDLHSGNTKNPETARMLKQERTESDILHDTYDFSELKPRGHYVSSEEMKTYFMAFKYFTTIFSSKPEVLGELKSLPREIQKHAEDWINNYMGFISPPRSPLVWKGISLKPPSYNRHPFKDERIFPLSWGFDNEVLYSTVYHPHLPDNEQITGKSGDRILPSGLDLAAALGNGFAESLLDPEFNKYPPLRNVMGNLKKNYKKNGVAKKINSNLYDRWITALAVQWSDTVQSPARERDKTLWHAKRLQTGLASWATLRHATGLVNERTAAECGEAGFEEILMRAPRGYVEPDPTTFAEIAGLFETAINHIPGASKSGATSAENSSLYKGVAERLKEIAQDARLFEAIARKQLNGEKITNEEYEKILYIGRVAEHHFLVLKSLAEKDNGLSNPDPIPKVYDVAGGGDFPFLMAAVGYGMEWDHVVPFFGRKQVVKGSVYSYYEFSSNELLNDKEWIEKLRTQQRPSWIQPFITEKDVSYPASGY